MSQFVKNKYHLVLDRHCAEKGPHIWLNRVSQTSTQPRPWARLTSKSRLRPFFNKQAITRKLLSNQKPQSTTTRPLNALHLNIHPLLGPMLTLCLKQGGRFPCSMQTLGQELKVCCDQYPAQCGWCIGEARVVL